jgi:hypothetical protein
MYVSIRFIGSTVLTGQAVGNGGPERDNFPRIFIVRSCDQQFHYATLLIVVLLLRLEHLLCLGCQLSVTMPVTENIFGSRA